MLDREPRNLLTLLTHHNGQRPIAFDRHGHLYSQRMLIVFLLSKDPNNFPLTTPKNQNQSRPPLYSSFTILTLILPIPSSMSRLSSVICQVPLLDSHLPGCNEGPEPSRPNHHPKRQETNTAPDGQVLPEWLTWSSVRHVCL